MDFRNSVSSVHKYQVTTLTWSSSQGKNMFYCYCSYRRVNKPIHVEMFSVFIHIFQRPWDLVYALRQFCCFFYRIFFPQSNTMRRIILFSSNKTLCNVFFSFNSIRQFPFYSHVYMRLIQSVIFFYFILFCKITHTDEHIRNIAELRVLPKDAFDTKQECGSLYQS